MSSNDTLPMDATVSPDSGEPRAALVLWVAYSPDGSRQDRAIESGGGIVGREAGAGVSEIIADERISRRHASIAPARDGSGFQVEDLKSRNGVCVNGQRVATAVAWEGDVIRIGDTVLVVAARPRPVRAIRCGMVGVSLAFHHLLDELERVAPAEVPVLLLGETGTGKELAARAVHELSGRPGRFVAVNCAAIPRELAEAALFGHKRGAFTHAVADAAGYFAQAENGTLFLDEIGELSTHLQPKLLRVLETRQLAPVGGGGPQESHARVVAATNADLGAEIVAGTFRADLFARLSTFPVRVPPLRQRRCDVLPLAREFFAQHAAGKQLPWTGRFAEALLLHDWPLNVRELRNVVQRLCLRLPDGTTLLSAHLESALAQSSVVDKVSAPPARPAPALEPREAPSRERLDELLRRYRGNIADVALHLGRERKQVYRWLEKLGLDIADYRG